VSDIVFDGMVFDRLREIGDQRDRIASLESEIARLRLTDEEREAINMARKIMVSEPSMNPAQRAEWAITLSRLLERMEVSDD
jgi:hypothetical protein